MTGAIHSMTGFARAEGRIEGPAALAWAWEIRSVNNKGLDVRLRLPPGFEGLDGLARQAISEKVTRGSIAANLSIVTEQDPSAVQINSALLDRLLALVADIGARLPPGVAPARLDGLLGIKGVIDVQPPQMAPDQIADRDRVLLEGLKSATDALNATRRQEGGRLKAVIDGQVSSVAQLVAQAASLGATQPDAIKLKLSKQLSEVLAGSAAVTPERLAQEVALLAVKGDIREEIDRLTAHVAQARELIARGGPCGRRLDFLSQECNREANTLCSKSQDIALTRVGLELKAVIDQFREQIQNIE